MKKMQFKTNINCNACIKSVTPFLNELDTVDTWQVDIDNPDKILTVESGDNNRNEVMDAVNKAGFEIEPLADD
ncbi:MAG: heavy-metal-associated domain-containing protein [Cytophagales bacterium]|nr:heavy-metal-associated domain-containing protein [Cytophagales bacterium]